MKKIMLYAYTAHNLGDDLFIYTLCQHYPNVQFMLYAPKAYQKTFAPLPNLNIVPNDHILQKGIHTLLKPLGKEYQLRSLVANQCDAAIYLGGSLFIEKESWKQDIKNVQAMLRHQGSLFLIGANFGPFTSNTFLKTYQHLLSQFTALSFRDDISKELFSDHKNCQQAADLVFQLDITPYIEANTNNIVISVIYPSIRKNLEGIDTTYFDCISKITMKLIENGFQVTLMAFCKLEGDAQAIQEIFKRIPETYSTSLDCFYYETNIHEALKQISQAHALIATRFHAMILGWLFKKPTYPIVYSDKMLTVMMENDYEGPYTKIENMDELDLTAIGHFMEEPLINIDPLIHHAKRHFSILEEMI